MILMDVRKNKRKTFLIVTVFFVIVALFVYFLSLWLFDDTTFAVIVGLLFSFITSFVSYYNSDKIVLSLNKAREATKDEYRQLNDILEGLCLATGLPMPKLYVMEDSAMNAFATGRNPKHSVICVTTGLLNRLDKYEIEGVLAHELSHIRNYDILLQTVTVVMVGFIVMLSDAFSRGFLRSSKSRDDDDNKGNAILMIIGLVFIILAPIFAKLIQLAISRNREYLADASAVEITRNKDGLINALKKISDDTEVLKTANQSTESLYIISPLKSKNKQKDSLFSTHPNTLNRIERLQNIQ